MAKEKRPRNIPSLSYLVRRKSDTNAIWGDLAAAERVEVRSRLARAITRLVFILVGSIATVSLALLAWATFQISIMQPNTRSVVDKALPSIFSVECGDSSGTGVAIKAPLPSGFKTAIFSAAHIFQECKPGSKIKVIAESKVYVGLLMKKDPIGKMTGADEETDLAVIYLRSYVPALEAAPEARLGDWSLVVGNPWDRTNYVNLGIVSAVYSDYYETDAAVNEGDSGGPLLDAQGRVLGIVVSKPYDSGLMKDNPSGIYDFAQGIAQVNRLNRSCSLIYSNSPTCPFTN